MIYYITMYCMKLYKKLVYKSNNLISYYTKIQQIIINDDRVML